ncbi:MAG: histidinol-phosphate transaminase [Rikenellaceae bacterium]|jgi:histidinol-phosphate aminotransferase|nr:histidinol-phosphate transaminase [Rikenellaceae bacterium]
MEVRNLFRENIRNLAPYSTARDEYQGELGIYLDANENPYENGYNRYPDPHQRELKRRLSEVKGIDPSRIFIGNGSDEAIDLIYRVFCEPRIHNVVSIAPSYGMYSVAAATNDVEFRPVQLNENFELSAADILSAADENTRAVFLCSPNNPSGNLLDAGQVREILDRFPGIVVVDEAYIDFADSPGLLPLLNDYPRLIVLQTLSKAWGMAGLRLGLAFADPEIVATMSQVKYPYNINGITQRIVLDQLADPQKVSEEVAEIDRERERLLPALEALPLIRKVFPTDANFVLVRVDDPRGVYNTLINEGVIVRDRSRIKGCEGCLRITIGTPAENRKLMEILKEL